MSVAFPFLAAGLAEWRAATGPIKWLLARDLYALIIASLREGGPDYSTALWAELSAALNELSAYYA